MMQENEAGNNRFLNAQAMCRFILTNVWQAEEDFYKQFELDGFLDMAFNLLKIDTDRVYYKQKLSRAKTTTQAVDLLISHLERKGYFSQELSK